MVRADVPPSPVAPYAEVHLMLELEPAGGSALLRVISTLHRRRCRVLHATFEAGTGGCDRLELRIQSPRPSPPQIESWLRGLIDVRHAACGRARSSD